MSDNLIRGYLLLALLAGLPFFSGIHHSFVYDDHGVIVENSYLQATNFGAVVTLRTMADPNIVDGQRPAVIASYLMDQQLWGQQPAGFRLTNILIHIANALLVFSLFSRICGGTKNHFVATLLFAWHPLMVETVQSPAFREDSLFFFGGLIFLHAALRSTKNPGWLAVGAMAYAGALLSKESAVLFLPLLAGIWWLYPANRPVPRLMALWMVVGGAISLWLALKILDGRALQAVGGVWNGYALRGSEAWLTAPWLAVKMLIKLVVPFPLSVDYRIVPVTSLLDLRFAVGVIVVFAGAAGAWTYRRSSPDLALAVLWMLIAFIPASNMIPLLNPVADRYAYAVMPGFVLLVWWLAGRWPRAGGYLLAAVAVTAAILSMVRIGDWKNDQTLWRQALRVEPTSARAYTWLGIIEKSEGHREQAWVYFVKADELNPHDVSASVNLAVMQGENGDLTGAEARLRAVLERRPDHRVARQNLNVCLQLQGRPEE